MSDGFRPYDEPLRGGDGYFLRNEEGRRPVHGGTEKFQTDRHWRDYVLFYEYFHGDNGAGLGASHQTGWTGLVAKLIQLLHVLDRQDPGHSCRYIAQNMQTLKMSFNKCEALAAPRTSASPACGVVSGSINAAEVIPGLFASSTNMGPLGERACPGQAAWHSPQPLVAHFAPSSGAALSDLAPIA